MNWFLSPIDSSLLMLAAILVASLYAYRWVPTTAMRMWVLSWGYHLLATALILVAALRPGLSLLDALTAVAGGIAALYMLVGALEFAGIKRPARDRWVGIGSLLAWGALMSFAVQDTRIATGPIFVLSGLATITAGFVIWQDRRDRHLAGASMVSLALVLWGVSKWDYVFTRSVDWIAPASSFISTVLGFFVAVGILVMVMAESRHYLQRTLDDVAALVQRSRTQTERFSALSRSAQRISVALDQERLLKEIITEGMEVLAANRCALYLLSEQADVVTCPISRGLSPEYVAVMLAQVQSTPGSTLIQTGKPLLVPDALNDQAYRPFLSLIKKERFHGIAFFPLQHEGNVIGALALYFDQPHPFTDEEVETGLTFAQLAASAIVHSRLYAKERQRASELEVLREVSMQLTRSLDLNTVLETVARRAREAVGATDTHLFVYDAESDSFSFGLSSWAPDVSGPRETINPRPEGLTATVARNGAQVIINHTAEHSLFQDSAAHGWSVHAIASIPLKLGEQVLGVLNTAFETPHSFTEAEVRLLSMLADNAAVAIANANLYRELADLNRTLEGRVQARTEELQALMGLGQKLAHVLSREELTTVLAAAVQQLLAPDAVACLVIHSAQRATVNLRGQFDEDSRAHLVDYLRKTVLECGGRMAINARILPRGDGAGETSPSPLRWPMSAQIHAQLKLHGQLVGLLWVGKQGAGASSAGAFSKEDERFLVAVAQQANNALARLEALEMRQRSRLQAILDSTPDGILLLDDTGHVEVASPTGQEMLSLLADLSPDGLVERIGGHAVTEIARHVKQDGAFDAEVSVGTRPLIFKLQARPVRERGKRLPGLLLHTADMTRERHTQEQLFQTSKLASVGELAAGVAHEINNPLTAIVGFSEMLMNRITDPEDQRMVGRIFAAGQRTRRIVQGLLRFSRGLQDREMARVDINDAVSQTVGLVRRQLELSGLDVIEDYADNLLLANTDGGGVGQIILNLLQNARDAIFDSSTGGRITVRTRLDGPEHVQILVEDDGPGIPRDMRSRIFDPFFTTKPPGQGTGLGLSISHRIARELGGQLSMQSTPGKGTTFTLRLPTSFTLADRGSRGPDYAMDVAALTTMDLTGRKILIVDDEGAAREIVQGVLESVGAQVTTLGDGQMALDHLLDESVDYDLVSLDIKMPGLSGIGLHKRLVIARPEIAQRVLFVTGDVVSETTAEFLTQSERPSLAKPFDRHELLAAVAQALSQAASGRRAPE